MLTIVACLAPSSSADGLFQETRQNPLTAIKELRCRFSVRTSVLWRDGKPEVRTETSASRLSISNIELQDGTAEVPGPRGSRFATVTLSDGSLFVMESTRGALHVTTVFATESSPGTLKAVRAEYSYEYLTVPPFGTDPTVWHSYGECEAGG
jgi:hypothetical protein